MFLKVWIALLLIKNGLFPYDSLIILADVPKARDMLSVRQETKSISPRNSFVIVRQGYVGSSTGEQRTVVVCQKLLVQHKAELIGSTAKATDISMFKVPPVLHNFLLVGIHSSVESYAMLQFDPIHLLSFRLSKMFKQGVSNIFQVSKEHYSQFSMKQENQMHFLLFVRWF